MFIHIGNDMSVRRSSVTAIINLETALPSRKDIADFMKLEDEQGRLQYVVDEIPKTLVITDDKTYVCSLSSQVLFKRLIRDFYGFRHKNAKNCMKRGYFRWQRTKKRTF